VLSSSASGGVKNKRIPPRSPMIEPQPGCKSISNPNVSHGTKDRQKPVLPTVIFWFLGKSLAHF
jgi:hypothetical protein